MKKKILMTALTIVCALCLSWPAAAVYTINPQSETITNYRQVYEAIYEALNDQRSYLDLTVWQIRDYDIMTIFTDVLNNSPEFFYVTNKLVYRYNQQGYVTSVSLSYHMTRTMRQECMEFYENEISYIVNQVQHRGLTEPEMALYVHDYLIAAYSYDQSESIYDVYGFLSEGKGVCHAYSLCYMAVMRQLGIPCYMVVSEAMNHSWNLISINDNWYHVDLVYDDPQPDRPGQVLHNYFMLSDDALEARGTHHSWVSSIPCQDNEYQGGFWENSETRMLFLNDTWIYIHKDDNNMYRQYYTGHGKQTLYHFTERWYTSLPPVTDAETENTPWWKGLYTGLSEYNGYVYFNSPETIWRFNWVTGEKMELLSLEDDDLNIYGINIIGNYMEYLVGSSPDKDTTAYTEIIPMRYTDEKPDVENVFLPFDDVSRVAPYYEAVEYLYDNGYINGMSETMFAPGEQMTRAQFAALLSRLYHYNPADTGGQQIYKDVSPDSWYAPYVAWVTESGYMTGTGSGEFSPDAPVTREQMYTIMASVGRSMNLGTNTLTQMNTADRNSVSSWAATGVDYCYTNGLIAEKYHYTLRPKDNVKRSEIADVLYRFCMLSEIHKNS